MWEHISMIANSIPVWTFSVQMQVDGQLCMSCESCYNALVPALLHCRKNIQTPMKLNIIICVQVYCKNRGILWYNSTEDPFCEFLALTPHHHCERQVTNFITFHVFSSRPDKL